MSNLSAGESVPSGSLAAARIRRLAFDLPGITALALIRVAIGLALLYAATIVYGVMAGYALPAATVFHVMPHPGFLTRIEDYVPRIMLWLALAGAGFGWLKYWSLIGAASTRQNQIAALRLLQRSGFFLLFAAAVLMLGNAWSGMILGRDFIYPNIGGLVPHSDAGYHFLSPVTQIITGTWSSFGSRRPFAAAFRELTMGLAGLSYVWALVLQVALVSAAFFAAARSVALWRGLWCALAFSAFVYVLARPFITNMFSESLGLFWGLLSIMFFVESMRADSKSTQADAIGFAFLALVTLTLGEMTRMGSMFTIPAFVLWISFSFSSTLRGRAKLFAIGSGLVLLVLGAQALLSALYGSSSSVVGGNFAFVLCGLTVGGDWTSCPKIYAEELSRLTTEREQAAFLYSKAFVIAAHDPVPMLLRMYRNIDGLITNLPGFMMFSYWRDRNFPWWPFVFLVPGFVWALWFRTTRRELLFWALTLASIVFSAAIVFADDGWRVFYTTWPYVALFASLGFASPGVLRFPTQSFKPVSLRGGTVLVSVLVFLTIIAPAVTRVSYGRSLTALAAMKPQLTQQEEILIGRTLTGFAVIPDDAPFPKTVPAMHVSDFRLVIDSIGLERDFGKFMDGAIKHVPFAFIEGAGITRPDEEHLYIAPLEILSGPYAAAWRVTLGQDIRLRFIHDVSAYQRLR